jgi:hypothetical protein
MENGPIVDSCVLAHCNQAVTLLQIHFLSSGAQVDYDHLALIVLQLDQIVGSTRFGDRHLPLIHNFANHCALTLLLLCLDILLLSLLCLQLALLTQPKRAALFPSLLLFPLFLTKLLLITLLERLLLLLLSLLLLLLLLLRTLRLLLPLCLAQLPGKSGIEDRTIINAGALADRQQLVSFLNIHFLGGRTQINNQRPPFRIL